MVKIGNRWIGPGFPCFIVAEIGINHNGSLEIAKQLIDIAVDAGCDAVKFQKRNVEIVYSKEELDKPREVHQSIIQNALRRRKIEGIEWPVLPEKNMERLKADPTNTTNGDLKYALEFIFKEYDLIDRYCCEKGIMWFASCWDGLSAHFINGFNVPCHKIASACLTHTDLLKRVRYKGKPIILSTGGSTMDQVRKAVDILGTSNLILLHCVASYPCKEEEINLLVIETLREEFGVPVGYSGHETGILPTIMAANLVGANMVERHITLDKGMPGSDHKASLEPDELKQLVHAIRTGDTNELFFDPKCTDYATMIFGTRTKKVHDSEILVMQKLRRVADF